MKINPKSMLPQIITKVWSVVEVKVIFHAFLFLSSQSKSLIFSFHVSRLNLFFFLFLNSKNYFLSFLIIQKEEEGKLTFHVKIHLGHGLVDEHVGIFANEKDAALAAGALVVLPLLVVL